MRACPRERFSSEVKLSPETVIQFATAAGDNNPIHHDREFAATTRFGRLTASGPQTTALLLALTAAHFSKKGAMLGLEFWVRFRRPIYADETIRLEWMVVRVTPNQKLQGEIVELRGRIKGQDGKTSLGAKGKILITDRL
jgi:3-hydroxybutyryl-CoA dehydratase